MSICLYDVCDAIFFFFQGTACPLEDFNLTGWKVCIEAKEEENGKETNILTTCLADCGSFESCDDVLSFEGNFATVALLRACFQDVKEGHILVANSIFKELNGVSICQEKMISIVPNDILWLPLDVELMIGASMLLMRNKEECCEVHVGNAGSLFEKIGIGRDDKDSKEIFLRYKTEDYVCNFDKTHEDRFTFQLNKVREE